MISDLMNQKITFRSQSSGKTNDKSLYLQWLILNIAQLMVQLP